MSQLPTWDDLRTFAAKHCIEIRERHGGVEIWHATLPGYPPAHFEPYLTIRPGHLGVEDADMLVRCTAAAALVAIVGLS